MTRREMGEEDEVGNLRTDVPCSHYSGYVLDYHKVLTQHDFDVMRAADALVNAAYLNQRRLDRKTKELIFIVSLTVMRSEKNHIQSHIRTALNLGVSKEEILEALEIALPEAGVVAFQVGFDAWREVVGAESIEPSESAFKDFIDSQTAKGDA